MTSEGATPTAQEAKSCCAAVYGSDWARLLLGDAFHPGGLALTERLGVLLELAPGTRVLDVAAGRGVSAIHLAARFGCHATGIDLSEANVAAATEAASRAELAGRARFLAGDAERLPFPDGAFDAVICECAFCTFPDKRAAVREFARVLRPGGRVGLSDLTRSGPLPADLGGPLAWVACIADARPVDEYMAYLEGAGFAIDQVEPHDEALRALVGEVRTRLLGVELLVGLKQLDLPGVDLGRAHALARSAADAVQRGILGYALVACARPAAPAGTGAHTGTTLNRLYP